MLLRTLWLVIALASAGFAAEPRLIAFERSQDVWTAHLDGSGAQKLAKGAAPDVARDGTRVAYNTDTGDLKTLRRYIAVADVSTRQSTLLKAGIPSDNCQGAVFSPDGSLLLFSLFAGSDWHLALVKSDGTGFRYVKKTVNGSSLFSITWAPDGRRFFAQDLTKIYAFSVEGAELKSWNVATLFPNAGLSSASRMRVSPSGERLMIDAEMDEEVKIKGWDGPAPALWLVDLQAGKGRRLTTKGALAWCGDWISDTEMLYVAQGNTEKTPSIYRMPAEGGKERQLVIKNGFNPSVSH